jgi:GTP-binding protein HflX
LDIIFGNTQGIKNSTIKELEQLNQYKMSDQNILDKFTCDILCKFTRDYNREIMILVNQYHIINYIIIGDFNTADYPYEIFDQSVKGLSSWMSIHTHPNGNPRLSKPDISSAIKLKLQFMVVISIFQGMANGYSIGVPVIENDALNYEQLYFSNLDDLNNTNALSNRKQVSKALRKSKDSMTEEITSSERCLLIAVGIKGNDKEYEIKDAISELEELVANTKSIAVGTVIQWRDKIDSKTYIGEGKLKEISLAVQNKHVETIVANDELSAIQIRNLEGIFGIKVIDRTTVILDIFAKNAMTAEGKLQVELAQLQYRLPRLTGMGVVLSRMGAGIGTRGPGEKKLEKDRRHIYREIKNIEKKLKAVEKNTQTQKQQRIKNKLKTVALVGYTNVGKSTLFNLLTNRDILAEDQLFATLDSTTSKIISENGEPYLLIDTVGFIDKLPHNLIESFKTTLSSLHDADLLLHVVDRSNPLYEDKIQVVDNVLQDIKVFDKPIIKVYNKIDKCTKQHPENKEDKFYISAKYNSGIDLLIQGVEKKLFSDSVERQLLIPYGDSKKVSFLYETAKIVLREDTESGIKLKVRFSSEETSGIYKEYFIQ